MRQRLSIRDVWQNYSTKQGLAAEDLVIAVLRDHVSSDDALLVQPKPTDLAGIYGQTATGRPHGIRPEFVIKHTLTGKSIWGEVKRQNNRGNAHERAAKYFAPGIVASAQEIGKLSVNVFPFWLIFMNGIADDARYRQEISHWFKGIDRHLFLWTGERDASALVEHFDRNIKPLLQ